MSSANADRTCAAHALYYVAPRASEIRQVALTSMNISANSDRVIVRALWSGISRGTEKLVFEGRVPESEFERMRAPFQDGSFPYPVKYGYSVAGVVEEGSPDLIGRTVFALHPHQTLFSAPRNAVTPLPDGLPARRAILSANMETALNATWDGGAGPGDKIVIIGAGAVGLLITSLAARLPGAEVLFATSTRPESQLFARLARISFCPMRSAARRPMSSSMLPAHLQGSRLLFFRLDSKPGLSNLAGMAPQRFLPRSAWRFTASGYA